MFKPHGYTSCDASGSHRYFWRSALKSKGIVTMRNYGVKNYIGSTGWGEEAESFIGKTGLIDGIVSEMRGGGHG
jgi:hypothetical protein